MGVSIFLWGSARGCLKIAFWQMCHHPDSDISIPFGLAFNMVEMSVNLDDRIGNYLPESLIMFIPQLYEVLALAIIRAKYLVDQGDLGQMKGA